MSWTPDREAALALLHEYTKGESLRRHAYGVDAAVRGYARRMGEDEALWSVTALLHDFDYERWPSLEDHPYQGVEILQAAWLPRGGDAGHPVACRLQRRDPRQSRSRRCSTPATRCRAS